MKYALNSNEIVIEEDPSRFYFPMISFDIKSFTSIPRSYLNYSITQVNRKLQENIIHKKLEEMREFKKKKNRGFPILFLLLIVLLITFYIMIVFAWEDFINRFFYIPFAIVMLFFAMAIIMLTIDISVSRKAVDTRESLSGCCDDVIRRENIEKYSNQGLALEVSNDFTWLRFRRTGPLH